MHAGCQVVEQFFDRHRNLAGGFEVVSLGWIEIDAKLIRMSEVVGASVPRVQIEAVHLGHPDDVALVAWSEHPARARRGESHIHQVGSALGPFDKQRTLGNAGVPAFQQTGSIEHPSEGAGGAHEVVLDHVEFGPALVGEHDFLGTGDPDRPSGQFDNCFIGSHDHQDTGRCNKRPARVTRPAVAECLL